MNRFSNLFRRRALERRMEKEFRHHLELLEAEYRAKGHSPEEARVMAHREFGPPEAHKDSYRDGLALPWIADFFSDLRFAARQLRRAPGFCAVAILTMALGVGANSAIFTLVNAALLREAPYPQPERLKDITKARGSKIGDPVFDSRQFLHFHDYADSFAYIAAARDKGRMTWVRGNAPTEITVMRVSPDYFRALGIGPFAGRDFNDKDGPETAVVSHRFALQAGGLEAIDLGGRTHAVLGVLPERFPKTDVDVYLPLLARPIKDGDNTEVFGRLREGVSLARAEQQATQLFATLAKAEYSNFPSDLRIALQPYGSSDGRQFQQPLAILSGAVGLILLIACLNLANLLLARASVRSRELAIRGSLGAGRFRLARQMLAESALLAGLGGVAGLGVAQALLLVLIAASPIDLLKIWEVKLDLTVLAYTLGVSIATGLLFGLIPAWNAARTDLGEAMKDGGAKSSAGGKGAGIRRALVVAEVALSVVLVASAGLLLKGFFDLLAMPSGADESRIVAAQMSLRGERYDTAAKATRFFEAGMAQIAAIPNVESVAVTLALPLERGLNCSVMVPDAPERPRDRRFINWRYTSPNYLAAMRVPLRAGRYFDDGDRAASQPVAIVSEEFTRRYLTGMNPIGRAVKELCNGETTRVIVGVAGDLKTNRLKDKPRPTMYVPVSQANDPTVKAAHTWFPMSWVIRTRDDRQGIAASVEKELRSVDPLQPIQGFVTPDDLRGTALKMDRFLAFLIVAFAVVALLLASAGLYGVLAYLVTQRRTEFAIRLALGASGPSLALGVLGQGLRLTAAGLVVGALAAFGLIRLVAAQVPGILPADLSAGPALWALGGGALILTSLLASLGPAARMLRLEPNEALRAD